MSLIKNSTLNLFGAVLPALVAIPALGYMARALDVVLFGVLMLVFAIVGYAGIFDAGLGKAVVRHTSIHNDDRIVHEKLIGTALSFVVLTGSVAAVLIIVFSDVITTDVFNISGAFYEDAHTAIVIGAFCVPFFLISVILQSYLEGLQKFEVFNVYRTVSGVLVYTLPVLGLILYGEFKFLMYGLLLSRVFSALVIFNIVSRYCDFHKWRFDKSVFTQLISFGGWLTVTNIISPMMVYMDRFIIARLVGPHAVAFYSAPAELINRMAILPAAITRAVFPKLAASSSESKKYIKKQAVFIMGLVVVPVSIFCALLAPELISLWLGERYVDSSVIILQVMIAGFLFNSLALISYNSLQACGKSFLTAKIHLFEVVPYLLLLLVMVNTFGLFGAALTWSGRMFVDMVVMTYFDSKGF